jgi:hypothetical protein
VRERDRGIDHQRRRDEQDERRHTGAERRHRLGPGGGAGVQGSGRLRPPAPGPGHERPPGHGGCKGPGKKPRHRLPAYRHRRHRGGRVRGQAEPRPERVPAGLREREAPRPHDHELLRLEPGRPHRARHGQQDRAAHGLLHEVRRRRRRSTPHRRPV